MCMDGVLGSEVRSRVRVPTSKGRRRSRFVRAMERVGSGATLYTVRVDAGRILSELWRGSGQELRFVRAMERVGSGATLYTASSYRAGFP